jgi:plasmid stabilization system protein ParE
MVIIWHPLALAELKEIYDYSLHEWGITRAKKTVANIRAATARLKKWPYSAPVELLLEDEPAKYRSMVIKRIHKVIYFVDEEKDIVVIFDVWDCRQDPEILRRKVTSRNFFDNED